MQYSPKLKIAMDQIKKILEQNDIAGFVVLHTPGYSEFLNHVNTTYSCAKIHPEGIRLKLTASEVGVEKAKQIANDTYNMVHHFARHISANAICYMDADKILTEKLGGEELDGGALHHINNKTIKLCNQ